jgi:glycosyltransferase involved in cell wall biosynthesis
MKKIIIVNSAKRIDQSFFELFAELGAENNFFAWTAGAAVGQWPNIKIANKIFPPAPDNFFSAIIFILLLLAFWAGYFFSLLSFKRQENIAAIICVNKREKLIFTPLAKILKIKIFWLELPDRAEYKLKKLWNYFSRPAQLLVFTAADAENSVKAGFKPENIYNISLGVNFPVRERQDDIFSSLAKADKPYSFYKNFTVGAICADKDLRRLEILVQAVKGCLNLIPNFRLVVIGQDASSANLNWLIKSLGLQQRVWLVGEQKNLLPWFDDLDLYFNLAENCGLTELERVLLAAVRGVPLLGWSERNLSDIISEGQNGLVVEEPGAEALAQQIITLEADERARRIMAENGKKMVKEKFDRQEQLGRLKTVLS